MASAQLHGVLRHLHGLRQTQALTEAADGQLLEAFARRQEEAPFAVLLRRHGPMVWSVSRRVLARVQDAEDVLQATFLLLARKAATIRKAGSVGNWLHGVAHRLALKVRLQQARRQAREQRAARRRPTTSPDDTALAEVQAALDTALGKLPEKYRAALVLCYLEGETQEEAARRLGCPLATLRTRLARGRKLLRTRLALHGLTLSTGGLVTLLIASAAQAAVPAALVQAAARAAVPFAGGQPAAALCSNQVAGLVLGWLRAMFLSKVKMVTVLVLGVVLAAGAAALARPEKAADDSGKAAAAASAKPQAAAGKPAADEEGERFEVKGRVLDPAGKPCVGAKLFLCDRAGKHATPQPATDGDGAFRFTLLPTPTSLRFLLASADGLGVDWADVRPTERAVGLTLRLPPDVPIRGKVLTLEGKPVSSATVRLVELSTSASGNLDDFLKRWLADQDKSPFSPVFHLLTEKQLGSPEALRQFPTATTGPDGTFCLTGVGRDRGVMVGVRGPGLADHYVRVVTRPDFAPPPVRKGQVALSGPEPVVAVAPGRSILGALRDTRTKQPLAGVRVQAYAPNQPIHWWWQPVETVTDPEGRYRLDGLAKGRQVVVFDPGRGAPHMHRFYEVGDGEGFAPVVLDAELLRGVVVQGRVTDRSTGRPVRARVVYCPLVNNEHYKTTPGYAAPSTELTLWVDSREMITGADGRFCLTALPGTGGLFVRAVAGMDRFTQPSALKEDRDPAIYHDRGELFLTIGQGDIFPLRFLNAYRLIRPSGEAAELTADFALDPGVCRRGRILDSEGKPLAGARAIGLSPGGPRYEATLPGPEFVAQALDPAKPRRLLFWHDGRKLAGTVLLRGDEAEPVTVKLQPRATLTGRALRKNGEPLVGYAVECDAWPEVEWPGPGRRRKAELTPLLTDKEGRFRVTDLPAGVPLGLSVHRPRSPYMVIHRQNIVLEPGQTRALGDLRATPEMEEP